MLLEIQAESVEHTVCRIFDGEFLEIPWIKWLMPIILYSSYLHTPNFFVIVLDSIVRYSRQLKKSYSNMRSWFGIYMWALCSHIIKPRLLLSDYFLCRALLSWPFLFSLYLFVTLVESYLIIFSAVFNLFIFTYFSLSKFSFP